MGAANCPKHGTAIGYLICDHAADAIYARRPTELYLQNDGSVWYGLCETCIRRHDDPDISDELTVVCPKCVVEWAASTGSDYRTRTRKPEFPDAEGG